MHQEQPEPEHSDYLENFQVLADFVFSNYRALLNDEERHFYHALNDLQAPARLLCIRLLMRRGEYVRAGKLNYPQAGPMALNQLQSVGLLQPAALENLPEWIGVFTKDELRRVNSAPCDGDVESLTRPDLFGVSPVELLQRLDTVYQVSCKRHYQIFMLLFFGNLYQDFSEFILRDLGLRHYEQTLTDTSMLPFHSREQLLAYWQYYQCCSCFEDAAALGADALLALYEAIPADTFNDPVLTRRTHQLYNKIARQLERESALDHAVLIYRQSDAPPARERLARVESSRGNFQAAQDICNTIKTDPSNSEELEFAEHFAARISAKTGSGITKPEIYKPPEISIELRSSTLSVERAAALYFAHTGHCYYVENSLLTGVFGLTFWDIIFAPISGVFFNPFQRAPLDFYSEDFTERRQVLIDERLQAVDCGDLRTHLFRHFHQKRGMVNPLVQWQSMNFPLLTLAITRISKRDWRVIFEYLLKDLKNHRSGLPDLIYFPNSGGYQLLEVKGPGDTLQKHQRRWMKHFYANNIPHAVVNADYRKHQLPGRQTLQLMAV